LGWESLPRWLLASIHSFLFAGLAQIGKSFAFLPEKMRTLFQMLCGIGLSATLFAQNGDKPGEVQGGPPPGIEIPPAPFLTPDQALSTLRVDPAFKVELVAAEPLVQEPVEIEFDPNGRIYVVEMRGFMRDADATGEKEPTGRISVLEDVDGDGRMDKSTVFADGLVMPRAMALVNGGVLVAEPPRLWFFQDKDGDGKAESKVELANDYGSQANPEHTANGLMLGLDNWIYSANHTTRYRFADGKLLRDLVFFTARGQWGISQDDIGRLFFNSNSDQFRGDLLPPEYLIRNRHFPAPFGGNAQLAASQAVWPIRVNPGVNRGYQKGQLRPDGTLATFTGACGPLIYRGNLFPRKFRGAGFLCEPTGNVVRCNLLTEEGGIIRATNAYDKGEFLASTDERFRPVNLNNGPDGALYIVDMYHGILQHRIYLTTYLRNQALSRGLEAPVDVGRIYRVVPADYVRASVPQLGKLSPRELVFTLADENGWRRDKAQQMLVEKNLDDTVQPLASMVQSCPNPLGSLHALWTLAGMNRANQQNLLAAMNHADERVRAAGVRLSEPYLRAEGKNEVSSKALSLMKDGSFNVRLQLLLSLGVRQGAEPQMLALFETAEDNPLMRSAVITGLQGREVSFTRTAIESPLWTEKSKGREELLKMAALAVMNSKDSDQINQLLSLAASARQSWAQLALLDGMNSILPPKSKNNPAAQPRQIVLKSEPSAFATLKANPSKAVQSQLETLNTFLTWKGKEGSHIEEVKPLSAEEQKLFEAGKETYTLVCGACHQPHGLGQEGLAPPLVDSDWATGSPERLTRIALQGLRGPITVKGKKYELEMPPVGVLEDEQIAGALTYIRREWGHTASPVTPDFVKKVREATSKREEAWTERELLKIP
jgi:mono/diheme cytochrome c family protein/glucose/arabinose dehydrogenase